MSLGIRLERFRKMLELSQASISTELGIDQTTYSKYVSGNKVPLPGIIILELKFGLNRTWLETGEGEMIQENEDILKSRQKTGAREAFIYDIGRVTNLLSDLELTTEKLRTELLKI